MTLVTFKGYHVSHTVLMSELKKQFVTHINSGMKLAFVLVSIDVITIIYCDLVDVNYA